MAPAPTSNWSHLQSCRQEFWQLPGAQAQHICSFCTVESSLEIRQLLAS
ncbi:hypothetical protein RSal33209_0954 [Renibacterium salmoninarum ATCC 33209]|uniref:Uncharacterized protein n=1 Tax=Renibacterium salmoninarum (strain ATCC 33209 / DSM 20767 / JCM 11484 / NBRC 15589 / NCIMB 2235) TaxID=288705 RepID=A9WNG8_RENSM|nr:hypothetical protein RSal33209_0954 [Renibacterium salmoninarum ATCC 33209]